ncbi:MAG: hypothetical protein J5925_04275 [Clostridia bacterium]|nr:hypothetical protein [Clostridia bacterium]
MKKTIYTVVLIILAACMAVSAVSCTIAINVGGSKDPQPESSAAAGEKSEDTVSPEESLPVEESSEAEPVSDISQEAESKEESAVSQDLTNSEGIYAAYIAAVEKSNAPDDIHCRQNAEQTMSMTIAGISETPTVQSVYAVYDSRYCDRHSDTPLLETHIMQGGSTSDIYADKEYFYVRAAGNTNYSKIPRNDPSVEQLMSLITEEAMMLIPLPEAAFEGATAVKKNGRTVIDLTPAPETITDYINNNMDRYTSAFESTGATDIKVFPTSASFRFEIDENGYIVEANSEMTMAMTMKFYFYDTAADVYTKVTATFLEPGKDKKIYFPEV